MSPTPTRIIERADGSEALHDHELRQQPRDGERLRSRCQFNRALRAEAEFVLKVERGQTFTVVPRASTAARWRSRGTGRMRQSKTRMRFAVLVVRVRVVLSSGRKS